MKRPLCVLIGLILPLAAETQTETPTVKNLISQQSVSEAFKTSTGVLVVIDCQTGELFKSNPVLADQPNAPCSTFKIWNTLIGLEEGLIIKPDAPFYKWDGEKRSLPDWNRDMTLRESFKASCVPAFQELARRIGPERMKVWVEKLDYGNKDLSAGVDVFWLPKEGRSCIQITPAAQAEMIRRLVNGKLPAKEASVATLKEVMRVEVTPQGALYGKTGSGLQFSQTASDKSIDVNMGWFVGFLQHGSKCYAYACLVLGPDLSGKDAKHLVEAVFKKSKML